MNALVSALAYILLAPLLGGVLAGASRILTARLQGRYGPPLLQPFFDVLKLFEKRNLPINRFHRYFLFCYLIFAAAAGALFFAGDDLLLVIFILILSHILLVTAAYSTGSPFSHLGASRELLQMLSAEPMLLIAAVGFYMVTRSFAVSDLAAARLPLIVYLPGVFLGFLYILAIKFRKSPFDLSTSHHAHQELVKGLTTEFAGSSLALLEIAHWYESVLWLGMVYLFFSFQPAVGVAAALAVFLMEVFVDTTTARVKWQLTFLSAWLVAAGLGGGNLIVLRILAGR